jgi:cystathionine beta-synthase
MDNNINAYNSILDLVGNTPLVKLNRITEALTGNFYAKVEAFNPGHSAKDRIAVHIIEEAESKGLLNPDSTIIETTSGNTGFSLAMASMVKGYKCIFVISDKQSKEKMDVLRAVGAEVVVCPTDVEPTDPWEQKYMFVLLMLVRMTHGLITRLQKEYIKKHRALSILINILMS